MPFPFAIPGALGALANVVGLGGAMASVKSWLTGPVVAAIAAGVVALGMVLGIAWLIMDAKHDVREGVTAQCNADKLADRVVVLRDGVIEQVGTPLEWYDRPANQFVAQFIGTPQMNMVAAKDLQTVVQSTGLSVEPDGFIGLRPENVTLCAAGQGVLDATVDLVEALGAETLIYVSTAGGVQLVSRQNARTELHAGHTVGLRIDVDAAHLFDAKGRITRTGRARETLVH